MSFEKTVIPCIVGLFFSVTFLCLVLLNTVYANGGEVSREQAIEIARQELRKATTDPARYEIYVDEDNKLWRDQMSLFRENSWKSAQEEYRKYNSILEGRKYWTIYFLGRTPDGRSPKDDSFRAIIDKETGKILFFIPGG
jgi:hypothetical protein